MFKPFVSLTALALLYSSTALAADVISPATEPVVEETVVQEELLPSQKTMETALKVSKSSNDVINRDIANGNRAEFIDFLRNTNALNKRMNPNAKDIKVNVDNKEELRNFMKAQMGVQEQIIDPQMRQNDIKIEDTSPRANMKRARNALQQ